MHFLKLYSIIFVTGFAFCEEVQFNFEIKCYLAQDDGSKIYFDTNNKILLNNFNTTRYTVFIIHGYKASADSEWITRMQKAFHNWNNNINVIVIDWSPRPLSISYIKSTQDVVAVGIQANMFLEKLVENEQSKVNKTTADTWGTIHCVGHSLGAHACGYFAKHVKNNNRIPDYWKIKRITGLDPAGPFFQYSDTRLSKTDAEFVDIIHTNAQWRGFSFGLPDRIGHMDFYPNGGIIQPGCMDINEIFVAKNDWYSQVFVNLGIMRVTDYDISKLNEKICSHGKAYDYFIYTLLPNCIHGATIWSKEEMAENQPTVIEVPGICNPLKDLNCVEMGINSIKYFNPGDTISKSYFILTGRRSPYCSPTDKDREDVKFIFKLYGEELRTSKRNVWVMGLAISVGGAVHISVMAALLHTFVYVM